MAGKWKQNVMKAVRSSDQAALDMLLQSANKRSLDFSIANFSPLETAVCDCQSGIVEQLLCAGASANFYSSAAESTPLMIVAATGNATLCKILLRYGAEVNLGLGGFTALCSAAKYGHGEVVALLLEYGAQLFSLSIPLNNSKTLGNSPLGKCVKHRRVHILEQFIEYADKINICLPLAALFQLSLNSGSERCAILLLRQGYYPTLGSSRASELESCPEGTLSYIESCFYMAACRYYCHLIRLMVEINPCLLQEEWLLKQELPVRPGDDFFSWLLESGKQLPALTKLCRSAILSQMGCCYLRQGKIDSLPLPNSLKAFLKSI